MEKTITSAEYSYAYDAFCLFIKAQYGMDVFTLPLCNGHVMPVRLGVNWAACGTVEPAEARDFAARLSSAADAAQNWEYNGFMIMDS